MGSETRLKPKDPERAAQRGGCVSLRAGYRETAIRQSNSVAVWKPSTLIPPLTCAGTPLGRKEQFSKSCCTATTFRGVSDGT